MDYLHILCKEWSRVKVNKHLFQSILRPLNIIQQEIIYHGCHKKLKSFIMSWDIPPVISLSKQMDYYTLVHNAATFVLNYFYAQTHPYVTITIPRKCFAILVVSSYSSKMSLIIVSSLSMISQNPTRIIIYSIISLLFRDSIRGLPSIFKL